MRNGVLLFKSKTGELPQLGIIFCGNRAVVSWRTKDLPPRGHVDVYFGLFFFLRLGLACARVYYSNLLTK